MAYDHQAAGTVTALNNELEKIELALRTKVSRKPDDERVMEADLDMNSNRILNLPAPGSDTEPVRRMDLTGGFTTVDDGNFVLYRSTIPPAPVNGHAWFDKGEAFYIGDNGAWNLVSGGSNSGGILYQSSLPISKEEGVTYFDADKMEHVYTYNDGDNLNYLAVPLLAGTGGSVSGGGGSGETSTFSPASVAGASLVALSSTPEAHKVKNIVPGTGLKTVATDNELTLNVDLTDSTSPTGTGLVITTDGTSSAKKQIKKLKQGTGVTFSDDGTAVTISATSGGGSGSGVVYSNTLPEEKTEQTTYIDHEKLELITTYNDGDSVQYLAHPLTGGGQQSGSGGGSTTTLTNAGSAPDGAALVGNLAGSNYPIRRIKAGGAANTIITETTNSVTIDALEVVAAGASGLSLVKAKTSTQQPIKRLIQGSNITLTDGVDGITIASSGGGGGGGPLGDTLTRLDTIVAENNNVPVFTAAGATQFLTTASTRAMMGLSTVGNTIPLFTGSSTATITALTPYMVSLIGMTGIPTALAHLGITSGSNANGNWLRIATGGSGGVQICWHTIVCDGATATHGSGFIGAAATWTYPQAFAEAPRISSEISDGVAAMIVNGATGYGTSSATFRQLAFVSSVAAAVGVVAIGYY